MKKKILFVTQQLGCGGVEKALINFLNLVDREKYDCELLAIDNSGEFKDSFPEWLTIHEYKCPKYIKTATSYYRVPKYEKGEGVKEKLSKTFWKIITKLNLVTVKFFKKNISYRFVFNHYKKHNNYSDYDMIVDYHGYGVYTTYWTAYQKTRAKKVSWVHEENIYTAYDYIKCVYKYFDYIFGVSQDCMNSFIKKFPYMKDRVSVLYNYLDVNDIRSKADSEKEDLFKTDAFKMVSVGRMNEQKSFHRAVEAAKILKDEGYSFKWLIVGDGEELEGLRQQAVDSNVDDVIKFVGFSSNPYAYIKQADIYVQTSRAEGFCTTISEALVLGKVIISTRVGGIEEQLDSGKGGIIVEHSSESIAEGIEKLINNKALIEEFEKYNQSKKMEYEKEIEKLYEVLD